MNFYVAARYGRKHEALDLARSLEELGHKVTSTWIHQTEDEMLDGPEEAARFAFKDLEEIEACDILVGLSEEEDNPYGRGGRHVEFGYALGLNKITCIVGPMENLFHYFVAVSCYDRVEDFLDDYKEQ